jgi:glutamyl-tRNA reductase
MTHEIVVVGLSHQTTPLSLREKLTVSAEALARTLPDLRDEAKARELVAVSTCNRIELYFTSEEAERTLDALRSGLAKRADTSLDSHLYVHRGPAAVRHAFRVASSLDSMVLGEPQILGQMKEAHAIAERARTSGALLSRCFTRAFALAKKVRTETGIAEGAVSVSSIACELAKTVFGSLEGRRVLLLGAGKMSESAARYLRKNGAKIVVVNRSPERGRALANEYGGEARPFEALESELVLADVVLSSTSSERPILTKDLMQRVERARRYRMLLLVDIALPRDIEPEVASLENIVLYDLDDLKRVADENLGSRRLHVARAEEIITAETMEFETWRRALTLTPTITALRGVVHEVVAGEIERTAARLPNADPALLSKMSEAIVNKLLHHAVTELKQTAHTPEGLELLRAARRLFDLDREENK